MNVKMRLLIIPGLLIGGLLGACGSQETGQGDTDVTAPEAGEVDVVQGEETPAMTEDQAGVTEEGETGDIDVVEGEADVAEPTTVAPAEEQAGAEATTVAPGEEQAGAEATTVAPGEEQAEAEATTVAPGEEQAGAEATTVAPGEEQAGATDQQTMPEMGQFDMMSAIKASEIIGYDVENAQGEDLGEIEDLVVDLNSSQVRYAVLSFGGFLDIGDKLFAIPLNAINFDQAEQAFIFDVTEEELEQAPGFASDSWPDTANPDWDIDFRDYWPTDTVGATESMEQDETVAEGTDATEDQEGAAQDQVAQSQDTVTTGDEMPSGAMIRVSELLDYNLQDAQNTELGEVEDVIIQMDQQHMAYAVLSLEDMADDTAQEEQLYAVPLNNLQLDTEEEGVFVFNIDQQALDTALSFSPDEWDQQMNLEDVN